MQATFRSVCSMAPVAAVLMLAILQLAVPGQAQSPPPGTVKIDGFSFAGSGCPAGSAEGVVSNDGLTLTVLFSKFTATTDQKVSDTRKSCKVTVRLVYPPGYVYTLGEVTLRGYADLASGVEGVIQTSYYISGLVGTAKTTRRIYGPIRDNVEYTDTFENQITSSCGKVRNLQLNSEVRVKSGKPPKPGVFTFDSQDLKLTQLYHIQWRTC